MKIHSSLEKKNKNLWGREIIYCIFNVDIVIMMPWNIFSSREIYFAKKEF